MIISNFKELAEFAKLKYSGKLKSIRADQVDPFDKIVIEGEARVVKSVDRIGSPVAAVEITTRDCSKFSFGPSATFEYLGDVRIKN